MTRRGKKRLAFLVVIVALVATGVVTASLIKNAQHERLLEQKYTLGIEAYEAGDYEAALDHLKYYMAANKTDGTTLLKFAISRLNVPRDDGKHMSEGVELLRTASTLLSDQPGLQTDALSRLIDLYGQMGYTTERINMCERLLRIDSMNRKALEARAWTLYALGGNSDRIGEAVDAFVNAFPDDPEVYELRFRLMDSQGASAGEILDRANALFDEHPADIGFALLHAKALANAGQVESARQAMLRAVDLEPDDSQQIRDLVRLLDRLGMASDADRVLARQIDDRESTGSDSDADVKSVMIERAWKRGNTELAIEQLPSADVDAATMDANLLGWKIFLEQTVEDRLLSSASFNELRQRPGDDAQWWTLMLTGHAAMLEGHWKNAKDAFRQANQVKPDQPIAALFLGIVSQRMGEINRATRWLELASYSDPVWAAAHQQLADAYIDAGRLEEAREAAEQALKVRPTPSQFILVADVYIKLLESGDGDSQLEREAINVFEKLLERAPDNPSLLALIARAYIVADRAEWAQPIIRRLINEKMEPATEPLLQLIDTCQRYGMPEGNELLALAPSEDGSDVRIVSRSAERAASEGRIQEGLRMLTKELENATTTEAQFDYRLALARFLDQFNLDGAKDQFVQLAQGFPESVNAQRALLESTAAWNDQEAVTNAVNQLRELTGDDADGWRVFEAKRLITFDPSPSNASQMLSWLNPTLRNNPENTRAQALAAEAYLILGDREAAIDSLARGIDANPLHIALYPRLIELLQQAGRMSEAHDRLVEFRGHHITGDLFVLKRRRGELLAEQGMWNEAIEEFESMGDRRTAADQVMLGQLYRRIGQTERARRIFEEMASQPDVTDTQIAAAADFLASIGEFDRGLEVLENLPEQVPAAQRANLRSTYFERAGRLEEAEAILRTEANRADAADAWMNLAWFLIRREELEEAQDSIQAGLAVDPNNEELTAMVALVEVLDGGELSADLAARIASSFGSDQVSKGLTDLVEADLWYQNNPADREGYLVRLHRIAEKYPRLYPVWHLLVSEYVTDGRADDALATAQQAAQTLPTSAQAAQLAAKTAVTFGRYDLALPFANRWRDVSLGDPFPAEATIAFIEWMRGDPRSALSRLERWQPRILQERQADPQRVDLLASLLVATGRTQEAHRIIWPLTEEDANWAAVYARLTEFMTSESRAGEWLDRVEPMLLDSTAHRMSIVSARFKLAQRNPSPSAFDHIITLTTPVIDDPEFPVAGMLIMADAYQRTDQLDEAETMYRRAIGRDPNSAVALNNLAYLLWQRGDVAGEAESLARQAIAMAEESRFSLSLQANFAETLGSILNRAGDHTEAIEVLEKARSLDPTNLSVKVALLEAFAAAGRVDDARPLLQRIDIESSAMAEVPADLKERIDTVRRSLGSQ